MPDCSSKINILTIHNDKEKIITFVFFFLTSELKRSGSSNPEVSSVSWIKVSFIYYIYNIYVFNLMISSLIPVHPKIKYLWNAVILKENGLNFIPSRLYEGNWKRRKKQNTVNPGRHANEIPRLMLDIYKTIFLILSDIKMVYSAKQTNKQKNSEICKERKIEIRWD